MFKYGLLDDEGNVVRWVWHPPPYPHIGYPYHKYYEKKDV